MTNNKHSNIVKLKRPERLKLGLLKLGEIADKVELLPSAVRYYHNMGLLTVHAYTQGKYRLFQENETIERINKIHELKTRGLVLEEIKRELDRGQGEFRF